MKVKIKQVLNFVIGNNSRLSFNAQEYGPPLWTNIKSHRCFHTWYRRLDHWCPCTDYWCQCCDLGWLFWSLLLTWRLAAVILASNPGSLFLGSRLLQYTLLLVSMFPSSDNRYRVPHTKGCGNIMWLYMCTALILLEPSVELATTRVVLRDVVVAEF